MDRKVATLLQQQYKNNNSNKKAQKFLGFIFFEKNFAALLLCNNRHTATIGSNRFETTIGVAGIYEHTNIASYVHIIIYSCVDIFI